MAPQACWIDCDVGHDDAFALILAAYNPSINLLGVSTCCGNQTIEKTTSNTLNFMYMAGLDQSIDNKYNQTSCIPVVVGRHEPLAKPAIVAESIHGESGLDGWNFSKLTPTKRPVDAKASEFIYQTIMNHMQSSGLLPESWDKSCLSVEQPFTTPESVFGHPDGVTIIATGPLTNVALLLLLYPEVKHLIKTITIMGGAIGAGNVSASAEFNIFVDEVAAGIVFKSGLPIVMTPLEVTHTALATKNVVDSIRALQSSFADSLCDLLQFFASTYKTVFDFDAPPLHDPCAVAHVINPSLFKSCFTRVDVETEGLSSGRTICDMYSVTKLQKNTHVLVSMDVDAFWQLMIDAIKAANEHSPINTNR